MNKEIDKSPKKSRMGPVSGPHHSPWRPGFRPAPRQAYEVSQELERKPERPLATIRQIRLQAPTRQNIISITKVSNSREVKRSGHSDAIDDSCSVCTMSCESM